MPSSLRYLNYQEAPIWGGKMSAGEADAELGYSALEDRQAP